MTTNLCSTCFNRSIRRGASLGNYLKKAIIDEKLRPQTEADFQYEFENKHRAYLEQGGFFKPGNILDHLAFHQTRFTPRSLYMTVFDYMWWYKRTEECYQHMVMKYFRKYDSFKNIFIFESSQECTFLRHPVIVIPLRYDRLKVMTDGSYNYQTKKAGCGVVALGLDGSIIKEAGWELDGVDDPYEAEVLGAYHGLRLAQELGWCDFDLYMDSKAAVHTLKGIAHASRDLFPLFSGLIKMIQTFKHCNIEFIYREGNAIANIIAQSKTTQVSYGNRVNQMASSCFEEKLAFRFSPMDETKCPLLKRL